MLPPTTCPCGTPLTPAQIKRGGKYCSAAHKGRYHRDPPRQRGFGLTVPVDKSKSRAWPGFQSYLESRGGTSGEASGK